VSSDQNLLLTDDFPPAGQKEFDLRSRRYLRFTLTNELAHLIKVTIGFRSIAAPTADAARKCVSFSPPPFLVAFNPNPLIYQEMRFEVRNAEGGVATMTRVDYHNITGGELSGLFCESELRITLPRPSSSVELKLTSFFGAFPGFPSPITVEAFNSKAVLVNRVQTRSDTGKPETLQLAGPDIKSVIVRAARTETLLHEICYEPVIAPQPKTKINITAFHGNVQVTQASVVGQASQVASATLEFDAISAVEVDGGTAALIDICFVPVSSNATKGWQQVPNFPYPMCLPLTHPDYPCSGGAPVNRSAAESLALGRVRYGPPANWSGAPFTDLHNDLLQLVVGGPGSTPMVDRMLPPVTATPVPPDPGVAPPKMKERRPLDTVLLSTLHPAIAQMIGLYWVDQSASPGVSYDYLIVADYLGPRRTPEKLIETISRSGFTNIEGYIVFNKKMSTPAPLPAPEGLKLYALSGSTQRAQGGALQNYSNSAGLRWNLGLIGLGVLQPDHAIMYHLWRAPLGNAAAPTAPGTYKLITQQSGAVLVAEPRLPPDRTPQRATDWPPFPLHYLDNGLADGWYGYQVSGVDIFGRHSRNSTAGRWYQWAPRPDPRPWYYQDPEEDREIHPFAVRLLDKIPPPPPTGVEAYALDPADPTVLRDAIYNAWRATLSAGEQNTVIGLRVRWLWTSAHMRQAPDTREFRIYYHPDQMNALLGRTISVSAASDTESLVETDIINTHPANAFVGAWLRIGSDSFAVLGSEAVNPLRVRVKNLGQTYTDGTISLVHGSATVTGTATHWHAGLLQLSLQVAGETTIHKILKVDSPTQLTLAQLYSGATAAGKSYTIFDTRPPANRLCTLLIPSTYGKGRVSVVNGSATVTGDETDWNTTLAGMTLRIEGVLTPYTIRTVDTPTQLTLDRNYADSTGEGKAYTIRYPLFTDYTVSTNWEDRYYVVGYNQHVTSTVDADGQPLRVYEVLLPAPVDTFRNGLPLTTSLAKPVAYAHIGVSAADDKKHKADNPKWTTGRWGGRFGNEGSVGPPAMIFRVRREPPPSPVPPPDAERVFATPADYRSESFYTYRWRAATNLQAHIFRALDDSIFNADWELREPPRTLRSPLDASQLQFFPGETVEPRWDAPKRQQVSNELNQLNSFSRNAAGRAQAMAYYRALSNDALRVLAALPGNDRAFTQVTIQPLDPQDPANADRRGPDSPDTYVPDASLRAFVDTLDGRSTNRYFYRSCYVDGAHNRSPLSLSGPPVWLPNVVPPRAPVITKVLGGDRQITLRWASNREADLVEYRIYRAESEDAARDIRLMTLVHAEPVAAADITTPPVEVIWTDTGVNGLVTYHYRLVAVDDAGNVSVASPSVSARAFDDSRPAPPTWNPPTIGGTQNEIELSWSSSISDLRCLVQRRLTSAIRWENLSNWLPRGTYSYTDNARDPNLQYNYRLRVMDIAGRSNNTYNELTV
jgi:hypothetical protein